MSDRSPEIDCCCDNQTIQQINTVDYSVCDNCGYCYDEEGNQMGYRDELEEVR